MRYSTSHQSDHIAIESLPVAAIIQQPNSAMSAYQDSYKINNNNNNYNQRDAASSDHDDHLVSGGLDSEDKSLLEKFYRETKELDPFLDDSLSTESLWSEPNDEQDRQRLQALLDLNPPDYKSNSDQSSRSQQVDQVHKNYQQQQQQVIDEINNINVDHHVGDWTFDKELMDQSKLLLSSQSDALAGPLSPSMGAARSSSSSSMKANYSPTLKLLTSYDPFVDSKSKATNDDGSQRPAGSPSGKLERAAGRIVGATLYGRDQNSRPNVSSKSPIEAVRLHDELMERPPNDGIVRVRMYFHRAIHDHPKLYGTGPWKYWGHGWGLEYGFDPRRTNNKGLANKTPGLDFYQKGYTIERAFGRDFCKDPRNCRKPDPNFFAPNQAAAIPTNHKPSIVGAPGQVSVVVGLAKE